MELGPWRSELTVMLMLMPDKIWHDSYWVQTEVAIFIRSSPWHSVMSHCDVICDFVAELLFLLNVFSKTSYTWIHWVLLGDLLSQNNLKKSRLHGWVPNLCTCLNETVIVLEQSVEHRSNFELIVIWFHFCNCNKYFHWFCPRRVYAARFWRICRRPLLISEKGQYGSRCQSPPVSSDTPVGTGRHVWCLQTAAAA